MSENTPDEYEQLSQAAEDRAKEVSAAPPPETESKGSKQVPILIVLLVVWAGALAYAIPQLQAEVPSLTYADRVRGALHQLELSAAFVEACLQADPPELPVSLPADQYPGVSYEPTGEKAYRLSLEVEGESISLAVAEDGDWTLSGKGTEPYQGGGE